MAGDALGLGGFQDGPLATIKGTCPGDKHCVFNVIPGVKKLLIYCSICFYFVF